MQSEDDQDAQRERLELECLRLEEKAGIQSAMEKAREGSFIPLGALGEPATPDEYFADEYDHLFRYTRRAYFSVEDEGMRMELISARRRLDELSEKSLRHDVSVAKGKLVKLQARGAPIPWTTAAIVGAVCVGVGAFFFETSGAIGGAVAGYFFGHKIADDARDKLRAEIDEAEQALQSAQESLDENSRFPEMFTGSEEFTGERDKGHDRNSAYANTKDQS